MVKAAILRYEYSCSGGQSYSKPPTQMPAVYYYIPHFKLVYFVILNHKLKVCAHRRAGRNSPVAHIWAAGLEFDTCANSKVLFFNKKKYFLWDLRECCFIYFFKFCLTPSEQSVGFKDNHVERSCQGSVMSRSVIREYQMFVWLLPWWFGLFESSVYCVNQKKMTRTNKFFYCLWFHSGRLGNHRAFNKAITRRLCSTCGEEKKRIVN